MNEEINCPCCPNHCDINNLSCGRGIKHFNLSKNESEKEKLVVNEESLSVDEKILNKLRKCGHFLHHSKETPIFQNLTVIEKENLLDLLTKCLDNWK